MVAGAIGVALSIAQPAELRAEEPSQTTIKVGAVQVRGEALKSSTSVPREPRYVFRNLTDAPATVEIVSLESIAERTRRALRVKGPRRITLAPHTSRAFSIAFLGDPVQFGPGLSYHRFALTVSSAGARGEAIASTAYICRIPINSDL